MTREEFKKKVDKISCYLSSPTLDDLHEIDDHDAEQRQVIEDLQKRVEELIDRRNNFHYEAVEWRGIEFDNVCTECTGSGYTVYGNTTTYHRGAGGQAITTSVCNICWGSGDKSRPWTSWLKIEGIQRQLELLKTDDAEQRAEIVRLTEWHRIVLGTGTDREAVIRMAAAEYTQTAVQCWKDKCDQQEQEIARLREALKDAMNLIDVDNLTTQTVYRNCQQALKE